MISYNVLIIFLFLFLFGSSDTTFSMSGSPSTTTFEKAKIVAKKGLPYPQFTAFKNLERFPGDVVCGEFESPDITMRFVTQWRPFIVVKGEMGPSNSPEAVDIYCSENPAMSLYKGLGIDLRNVNDQNIAKVRDDLSNLVEVIKEYERLNDLLPPSSGGLSLLLNDGTVRGMLDAIPMDPWGNPYNYESVQWGGSATRSFELWSFGKDNKRGGVGDNADISYKHLPYLIHVASLSEES